MKNKYKYNKNRFIFTFVFKMTNKTFKLSGQEFTEANV